MELKCNKPEELTDIARALIESNDARVFAFYGEMGAGKTTFIRSICEVLGVEDIVNSPTFSIVNEYSTGASPVYHFDFYRIKSAQEAWDMGHEEYFYSGGYCLIEWPEKIEGLLPEDCVEVSIIEDKGTRTISW